jgi:hypothetical protein
MAGDWRFILAAIDGSGNPETILHPDLPLLGSSVTNPVSATPELRGRLEPYDPSIAEMISEWGTAIYAEASGQIRGGGIVVRATPSGPRLDIECIGLTGYPNGMPYTGSWFGVEIDPLDVYREIWRHLQAAPGGDLGLVIPDTMTGRKIGTELEQEEFDTESGPISFEAGPVKLNWYETHDLGQEIEDLSKNTPFDYLEIVEWDGDNIGHRVELGYPRLGRRRNDLRFVVGENILAGPPTPRDGDLYANEMEVLGAGAGRTMIRGRASLPRGGRLRRVAVEQVKSLRTIRAANARAMSLLKQRIELGDVTDVTVLDHPHAPLGSFRAGDEILIEWDHDWQEDLEFWVRVQSITLTPDSGTDMTLSVIRSDKVG